MEIFHFNIFSNNNKKLFLNVVTNFFYIKQRYLNEYSNRNTKSEFTCNYQKKVSKGDLLNKNPQKDAYEGKKEEHLSFAYSTFGIFFFNNFHQLSDGIILEKEDPQKNLKFSDLDVNTKSNNIPTVNKFVPFEQLKDFHHSSNSAIYHNFFRLRPKPMMKFPLDIQFKYFINVKLANWKINFALNKMKEEVCRNCKEILTIEEFILHSYNCQEKRKNIKDIKIYNQQIIDLSKKLQNIKK